MKNNKMDFELQILIARSTVVTTRARIEITLDEIKKVAPDNKKYIVPMSKTVEDLFHAYQVYDVLEKEWRAARQRNADLEYKFLTLRLENEELKKEVASLKQMFLSE
jgi:chaperonin cofactor prefoldin